MRRAIHDFTVCKLRGGISTYKVCRLVIPLKVPLGRLLMLLSYSDLQGNHHDDADNYEFTMMAMITMMVVVTTMTLK